MVNSNVVNTIGIVWNEKVCIVFLFHFVFFFLNTSLVNLSISYCLFSYFLKYNISRPVGKPIGPGETRTHNDHDFRRKFSLPLTGPYWNIIDWVATVGSEFFLSYPLLVITSHHPTHQINWFVGNPPTISYFLFNKLFKVLSL